VTDGRVFFLPRVGVAGHSNGFTAREMRGVFSSTVVSIKYFNIIIKLDLIYLRLISNKPNVPWDGCDSM